MQELRTIYDTEDALNMYESIIVPRINEYYAAQAAKQKQGF